jgi:hypothetical protein
MAAVRITLGTHGFYSQFNNFLCSFLFAATQKRNLHVMGDKSCVGKEHNLVKELLLPHPRIKFTPLPASVPNSFHSSEVLRYCRKLPRWRIKRLCRKIYRFNPATQALVTSFIQQQDWNAQEFHIGIHYRSGDKLTREMKPVTFQQYCQALLRTNLSRPDTHIFIMSDNYPALQQLQAELVKAVGNLTRLHFWSACPKTIRGHYQREFNQQTEQKKQADLIQLLAEVEMMRRIPTLLLLFSSNVDRFIWNAHLLRDQQVQVERID